ERYVRDGSGDVLYNVVRAALAALLSARRSPSLVPEAPFEERTATLVAEPLPDTVDGRNRRIRTRLGRMLLDDPVVYYGDLSDEERAYFEKQRPFLMRELGEATGLEREERLEGAALVDPSGEASDIGLPEEGTDGHVTLLLATWLAERLRAAPAVEIGDDAWRAQTAAFIDENRGRWRKDVTQRGAEITVAHDVAARLEGLGLVRRTARGIAPQPAIGRYALRPLEDSTEGSDGR
ncbi:MAG: TIGR02678 family protein, partial [Candidatus Binatia bacterium]